MALSQASGAIVGQGLAQDGGAATLDFDRVFAHLRNGGFGADAAGLQRAFPFIGRDLLGLHYLLADKFEILGGGRSALKIGQDTAQVGIVRPAERELKRGAEFVDKGPVGQRAPIAKVVFKKCMVVSPCDTPPHAVAIKVG